MNGAGLYNKGKTFLLNRLSGANLISDTSYHTRGLSFKVQSRSVASMLRVVNFLVPRAQVIKNETVSHILLDTAGLYAPVAIEEDQVKLSRDELTNLKASELFKQQLTFSLADIFVVVVEDFTSLDQDYLRSLQALLEKKKIMQVG